MGNRTNRSLLNARFEKVGSGGMIFASTLNDIHKHCEDIVKVARDRLSTTECVWFLQLWFSEHPAAADEVGDGPEGERADPAALGVRAVCRAAVS